jgi:4'-phosphopantetheinyl transferase
MSPSPPIARTWARSVNHASAEETASGDRPTHGAIYLYHANLRQTGWWRLVRLLSAEERRQADAFAFERDARRFIVSHAVLRTLLGHATGIPPDELSFQREPGLKPVLEATTAQPIHFSLSRAEELVLIGLASRPLGVDIEWRHFG